MQQREMPMHGVIADLRDAPTELLKMCDDERDAIRLCIQLGGFTNDFIGKKLGIDKGQFSRVMSNSAHFPTHKRIDLMTLCGNRVPTQYEVSRVGSSLVDDYVKKIGELEAKCAALEGALSALIGAAKVAERVAA